MRIFHAPFLVCVAAGLAGCGLLGKKQPDTPEATLPTWVGRIVMVDTTHRFVLIDAGAPALLEEQARLLAFRDRRVTAVLEPTAESRPPYVAANIVEGAPASGDMVALDESREPESPLTE